MNGLDQILVKMPDIIKDPIQSLPSEIYDYLEEIRLVIKQPVIIKSSNREITLNLNNREVTAELLDIILNNLMNYSTYAYEEELSKGYITIEGGHRVGICGRVVIKENNICLIKDISSMNIRRSREITGIADNLKRDLIDTTRGLQNTVIVSPPKCGKTTLLRDIIRLLSYSGMRIGVCDERSEIAGMYRGIPSYDLGPRTDVLDGCPKAEGMMMLIRSMSPDAVVTDEIGKSEDIEAIESAICCGVKIITTIHGRTYEDLLSSVIGRLVENRVFTRIIFLSNIPSTGTVSEVRYV